VRRLPKGAQLHLVSHSRGGLVGELLCLGQCEGVATQLDPARLTQLFAADRTIADQLGLLPLSPDELKERDAAYAADRAALAELLAELATREIRVTRFVRVACPARGTTLASGRLDRWLSMLNFLAGKALGESPSPTRSSSCSRWSRSAPTRAPCPGLEAMMPGSALTRLLHHPELVTAADLSVIAGDVEGASPWQKIKLLVTDWFYGADHDLVVNTGAMSGGLRRAKDGARFRLDRGAQVNHFSYFHNPDSVGWLLAGLTRRDDDAGGFLPIAEAPHTPPRWREAVARSQQQAGPRPLAVVLPGTMGSSLSAGGRPGVAPLPRPAARRPGRHRHRPPRDQRRPPDRRLLRPAHRVPRRHPSASRLFPTTGGSRYAPPPRGWRTRSSNGCRAEQAGQPVHLVAHSMGGLVVRAMIADGSRGAALWQRITRLPGSRLLMLGTPNFGSYEALRWLTATNPRRRGCRCSTSPAAWMTSSTWCATTPAWSSCCPLPSPTPTSPPPRAGARCTTPCSRAGRRCRRRCCAPRARPGRCCVTRVAMPSTCATSPAASRPRSSITSSPTTTSPTPPTSSPGSPAASAWPSSPAARATAR
jgi:hypothetical protein